LCSLQNRTRWIGHRRSHKQETRSIVGCCSSAQIYYWSNPDINESFVYVWTQYFCQSPSRSSRIVFWRVFVSSLDFLQFWFQSSTNSIAMVKKDTLDNRSAEGFFNAFECSAPIFEGWCYEANVVEVDIQFLKVDAMRLTL